MIRTTPTGVGKTAPCRRHPDQPTDHPHGRGEDRSGRRCASRSGGPPPRAWGRRGGEDRISDVRRTTPTGVGKTTATTVVNAHLPDHPHGRGEDVNESDDIVERRGPPPRAWGRRSRPPRRHGERRTTPTGVGKTRPFGPGRGAGTDHPHGRGEDALGQHAKFASTGPPPRAWGRRRRSCGPHPPSRTTPTGVGKTRGSRCACARRPDHPHGRGEDCWSESKSGPVIGPPPRAWGRRYMGYQALEQIWTTPTGVGKTTVTACVGNGSTDHPHGRGEDSSLASDTPRMSGPPPRAWGRHSLARVRCGGERTTPTGVGKTTAP